MSPKLLFAALALPGLASAQTADPAQNFGSLFPTQGYRSSLSTRTAFAKGDLVTILVSENSVASFSATTNATKKDTNQVDRLNLPILDFLGGTLVNKVLGNGYSTGANSSVSGTGTTTQSGQFTARLTAVVKEVLPNGNLVIEGKRYVKVNNDFQTLVLTGTVRRDDVRDDNTVLSESVADATIKAEGKGVITDRQRRGILTRILEWLF